MATPLSLTWVALSETALIVIDITDSSISKVSNNERKKLLLVNTFKAMCYQVKYLPPLTNQMSFPYLKIATVLINQQFIKGLK